jgi:hypothetical protein
MRLITWTLRSGSEQFIYNWNGNDADLDQGTGSRKKERTKGLTERTKSRVKATCKLSRLTKSDAKEGLKVMLRQHANCQD